MSKSKRSRIEIYVDVLRTLRTYDGGCRITRLAYGSNMPLDRMRKTASDLMSHGLIGVTVEDPGIYFITARGMEFLEAYKKLSMILE